MLETPHFVCLSQKNFAFAKFFWLKPAKVDNQQVTSYMQTYACIFFLCFSYKKIFTCAHTLHTTLQLKKNDIFSFAQKKLRFFKQSNQAEKCKNTVEKLRLHGNLRDSTPKLVRSDFSYYLAGLIEGDGCINVPKKQRSVKGKKLYCSIEICFNLRDFPLCMLIQQKLKCGSIHRKAHSNAYILTINNMAGVLHVIHLINGVLRTPKIYTFHALIDFVNTYQIETQNQYIHKLPIDETPFSQNAWFAGFLQADGCFYIRITIKKLNVKVGFYLEQAMTNFQNKHSSFSIMKKISVFLCCNLKKLSRTRAEKKNESYRVVTSSEKSHGILIEYLRNYNIFSSKYLDYKDWEKAFTYIKQRKTTVKHTIPLLLPLKENINSKRETYNWDHLQNFYT